MARNTSWSDSTLKRYLDEGRGQGDEDYKPWLKVDMPSRGRVTRIFSKKMNRTMHLLTDTQTWFYYLLEFDPNVIMVKEQYPILDIGCIVDQLDESLVKRLKNRDGTPHVLVTTFLITANDGKGNTRTYARSIKDRHELEKKATLERLEIQRRYYESLNFEYAILTADEIPFRRARNIEWVLPALNIEDIGYTNQEIERFCSYIIDGICSTQDSVWRTLGSFEREAGLQKGLGLYLFRYLIASRQIEINLDDEIDISNTPEQMGLVIPIGIGVDLNVRSS